DTRSPVFVMACPTRSIELQARLHPVELPLVVLDLLLRPARLDQEEAPPAHEDAQRVEVRLAVLVVPEAQLVPRCAVPGLHVGSPEQRVAVELPHAQRRRTRPELEVALL